MTFWNIFSSPLPIVQGYCRICSPNFQFSDSTIFQIIACASLYMIVQCVLAVQVARRRKIIEEAEALASYLEREDPDHINYMKRCVRIAESAEHEYNHFAMSILKLWSVPTRKLCRFKLDRQTEMEDYESMHCLADAVPPSMRQFLNLLIEQQQQQQQIPLDAQSPAPALQAQQLQQIQLQQQQYQAQLQLQLQQQQLQQIQQHQQLQLAAKLAAQTGDGL